MSPLSEGNHASPQAQPLWSMYRYNGSWIEQLAELTGLPVSFREVEAESSTHRRKFKSAALSMLETRRKPDGERKALTMTGLPNPLPKQEAIM